MITVIIMIVALMEAVRTSETSVYSNETPRHYIPEGSNLQVRTSFTTAEPQPNY
jgi:hypothetical protein